MAAPAVARLEGRRFFFALKPDAATAARAHEMARLVADGRRPIALPHLHVTLALCADLPRDVAPALDALLRVGAMVRAFAFPLAFDLLTSRDRHVVLRPSAPPDGLFLLQDALARGLARAGLPLRAGWTFDPHMTLATGRGATDERPVAPLLWQARDFVLVRSDIGLARHAGIGRWPLSGPA